MVVLYAKDEKCLICPKTCKEERVECTWHEVAVPGEGIIGANVTTQPQEAAGNHQQHKCSSSHGKLS
ncbi:hypothetical protein H5410_009780 [Solanum commersonii]|uniref:Uncharacterized protein n=1 Tax=Solanum commersonii TaxID=4109 RepID=A0A9J6AKH9_SOLCO|nr:hypothetical protein H5410_009780 [Solanum commersonii]